MEWGGPGGDQDRGHVRNGHWLETDRWEGWNVHTAEALCPVRVSILIQPSLPASVLALPEKT